MTPYWVWLGCSVLFQEAVEIIRKTNFTYQPDKLDNDAAVKEQGEAVLLYSL